MQQTPASICSVLHKGSQVQIAVNSSHKSPHLNGKVGEIVTMPVHPTTWFKIKFVGGEVATFRSSALIPLDEFGKPMSAFVNQAQERFSTLTKPRPQSSSQHKPPDQILSRRILRESSRASSYVDSPYTNLMSVDKEVGITRERSRRNSKSFLGNDNDSCFFQRYRSNSGDNGMINTYLSKCTAQERKLFDDFVEVAFACAYVPECARKTHCYGLLANNHSSDLGLCCVCGDIVWRGGFVGQGFCWNDLCSTSPIYKGPTQPSIAPTTVCTTSLPQNEKGSPGRGRRPPVYPASAQNKPIITIGAEDMPLVGEKRPRQDSTSSAVTDVEIPTDVLWYDPTPAHRKQTLPSTGIKVSDSEERGIQGNAGSYGDTDSKKRTRTLSFGTDEECA